jgi:hypothetical protein
MKKEWNNLSHINAILIFFIRLFYPIFDYILISIFTDSMHYSYSTYVIPLIQNQFSKYKFGL